VNSALIAAAVAALCGLGGWWLGTEHVQARWDKAERDRAEAVVDDLKSQAWQQFTASKGYQADRAARERRAQALQPETQRVLDQPAPVCTPGARAGDIVLPGGLGRLLNAVADDLAPPPPSP